MKKEKRKRKSEETIVKGVWERFKKRRKEEKRKNKDNKRSGKNR